MLWCRLSPSRLGHALPRVVMSSLSFKFSDLSFGALRCWPCLVYWKHEWISINLLGWCSAIVSKNVSDLTFALSFRIFLPQYMPESPAERCFTFSRSRGIMTPALSVFLNDWSELVVRRQYSVPLRVQPSFVLNDIWPCFFYSRYVELCFDARVVPPFHSWHRLRN